MLLLLAILNSFLLSVESLWNCPSCTVPKTLIASSSQINGDIKVWDPYSGTPCYLLLTGHTGNGLKSLFSSDMSKLYSTNSDYTLKAWDLTTGQCILTKTNIHTSGYDIRTIDFHPPNDDAIVTSSLDGTIKIWRITDFALLLTIPKVDVYQIALSPDGNKIAALCMDALTQAGSLHVFDYNTGALLKSLSAVYPNQLRSHVGFLDNNYLYCLNYDENADNVQILVYDIANDYAISNTITVGNGYAYYALRVPKRNELIISWGDTFQIWNINTWQAKSAVTQLTSSFDLNNYQIELRVSFDEKYLFIGDAQSLILIDYDSLTTLHTITEPYTITMNSVGSKCYCSPNVCCLCNGGFTSGAISSQCAANYFSSDTCVASCTSPCITCEVSPTTCKSCISNFYLYGTSCVNTCPQSTYPDSNDWKCKSCDTSCLSCTGPGANSCASCCVPNFLDTNTCLQTCPSGKYGRSIDNSCQLCNSPCENCENSESSCTTCIQNYFLSGTSCVQTCQVGTYPDSNDWKCKTCDPTCHSCTGPYSDNCNSCTNTFLSVTSCVNTCPQGTYPDSNEWKCKSCDSSCLSCTGAGSNSCASCCVPNFLDTNTCLQTCPSGKYGRSIDNSCQLCNSPCKNCENSENTCTTCIANYYLWEISCVQTCQVGTYPDSNDWKCKTCDPTCRSCTGPYSDNCNSCTDTFLSVTSCVNTCPQGTYPDSNDWKCKFCDSSCLSCTGPSTNNCASCCVPNFLDSNSCLPTCPSGKYGLISDNTCQLCNPPCETCENSESSCTTCILNYFLWGISCLQTCQEGTYPDSNDWKCKSCDTSCRSCTGPNNDNCNSCTGKFLSGTSCLNTCPHGTYPDSNDWKCKSCDNSCLSCTGPATNNCASCCVPNYLDTNTCLQTCPSGKYGRSIDNSCQLCNSPCENCENSENSCTTCIVNYYLWGISCVQTCQEGTYPDSNDWKCKSCDTSCRSCTGPNTDNCDSCTGKFLSGTSCVNSCPQATYPDSNDWKCKTCDPSCLTCTGPGTNNCASCFVPNFLDTNTCSPLCPVGKFGQKTDNTCQPCIAPCQNCAQTGSACTNCIQNNYLSGTSCSTICPHGTYSDSKDWKCKSCNAACSRCTGPNSNNCLSCLGAYFLVGTNCTTVCPSGKFPQTNDNTCAACKSSCMTCFRNDSCLTCRQGLYLFDSSTIEDCITCNISGYSIKESYCIKCPSKCRACSDGNFCERCLEGYYLQFSVKSNKSEGICKACDLPGEYIDRKYGLPDGLGFCLNHSECQIKNCKICSNLYKECPVCDDGFFTHHNSEKGVDYCSPCGPNYYVKLDSSGNKSCLPKLKVSADLSSTNNQYEYRLLFNETLDDYFRDYLQNFALEIKGKSKDKYSCNITQNERNKNLFLISCSFNWNVTTNESLTLKLLNIPEDSENSSYEIRDREFSVTIESKISCSTGYSYNKDLAVCEPPPDTIVNIQLRNTKNPLKYHLVLDNPITENLEVLIRNSLKGTISNTSLNNSVPANFTINKIDDYTFELGFNFSQTIMNSPVFYLDILPGATNNVKFTNTELSIPLSDYYLVSKEDEKKFEQAGDASKSSAKASDNLISLNAFILPGSLLMLKGIVLIQTFQLLKFIRIDYPPNVLSLFEDKLSSFAGDFDIKVDPRDGILDGPFYKFNFSNYFLNNSGSYMIAGFLFMLLGVIGSFVFPVMRRKFGNKKIILRLIDFLENSLIWNYFLNHFLSRYMILVFIGAAAFRFPTLKSGAGINNFIFALLSNVLLYAIPVVIFVKLSQAAKLRTRKIVPVKADSKYSVSTHNFVRKESIQFEIPSPKNEARVVLTPESPKKPYRLYKSLDTESQEMVIENKDIPFLINKIPEIKSSSNSDNLSRNLETQITFLKKDKIDGSAQTTETHFIFKNEELDKIMAKYKPIHEDYRNDNWVAHYFIIFELIRQIITALLILNGDASPVMVALLIMLINGLFIIFLIWVKPYKSFQKFILTILVEFFLFIICLGVLGLGFLQSYISKTRRKLVPDDFEVFLTMGWFIVIANILMNYIFLAIQIIFYCFEFVKFLKIISPQLISRLKRLRKKD